MTINKFASIAKCWRPSRGSTLTIRIPCLPSFKKKDLSFKVHFPHYHHQTSPSLIAPFLHPHSLHALATPIIPLTQPNQTPNDSVKIACAESHTSRQRDDDDDGGGDDGCTLLFFATGDALTLRSGIKVVAGVAVGRVGGACWGRPPPPSPPPTRKDGGFLPSNRRRFFEVYQKVPRKRSVFQDVFCFFAMICLYLVHRFLDKVVSLVFLGECFGFLAFLLAV